MNKLGPIIIENEKWMCIKDSIFLKQGDIIIFRSHAFRNGYYMACSDENNRRESFEWRKIREYFVNLADYREEQIKSILD
jgi:hypothetical protein